MIRSFSNTRIKSASVVFTASDPVDVIMIDFINFSKTESATIENKDYIRSQLKKIMI